MTGTVSKKTSYVVAGEAAGSKLANVMHTLSLADRGREAYSLHPGVIQTKLLRQGFGPVRGASVEAGARTTTIRS